LAFKPLTMQAPESALLKGLWWANLAAFGVLSAGAFALVHWHSALSVLAGGAIALVNYCLLERTVRRALLPAGQPEVMGRVLVKYYLRFAATAVVLFFLVRQGWVEPLGLLAGLSVVVLTFMGWGLCQAIKLRKEES
jgi:hypothetical protein